MSARLLTPVAVSAGDRVRVVDPRRVLRVGYPKCAADYLAAVCEQHEETLRAVFGFPRATLPLDLALRQKQESPVIEERVAAMPRQLARALWDAAYLACKRDRFGGKERRVHLSDPMPEWLGVEFLVSGVRSVREGTYYPSGHSVHYDGSHDFCPGKLENARVRRLVGVRYTVGSRHPAWPAPASRPLEFPIEHLERVCVEGAADDAHQELDAEIAALFTEA